MTVVCLGEALIDLLPTGGASQFDATHFEIQPGGAPLNVAIRLKRAGVAVRFLGALSLDPLGRRLAAILKREGIPRVPPIDVDAPTRLALVDIVEGESAFRFVPENPADTWIEKHHVEHGLGDGSSGLYLGSLLMLNERSAATQRHAVDVARRRGITIYSDPNPRPAAWNDRERMEQATAWLLEQATLAKLSLADAEALGWPLKPAELIRHVARAHGATLVVTDGPNGCWGPVSGEVVHVPSPAVHVVDTTGAGDAFFAALIAAVHPAGEVTEAALARAVEAGALATTHRGAQPRHPQTPSTTP